MTTILIALAFLAGALIGAIVTIHVLEWWFDIDVEEGWRNDRA